LNKIKFLDAMAFVARYFKPLHLQASLHRPLIVTIEIKDPDTELFVKIQDYPVGTALSCGAIMELIANIEAGRKNTPDHLCLSLREKTRCFLTLTKA